MDKYKFVIGQEVIVFHTGDVIGVVVGRDSYSPDDTHWYAVHITKSRGGDRYLPVREDLLTASPNIIEVH